MRKIFVFTSLILFLSARLCFAGNAKVSPCSTPAQNFGTKNCAECAKQSLTDELGDLKDKKLSDIKSLPYSQNLGPQAGAGIGQDVGPYTEPTSSSTESQSGQDDIRPK